MGVCTRAQCLFRLGGRDIGFHEQSHAIADPGDEATFRRSQLNWQEVESARHADMLQWYRDLIRLHRQTSAFSDGRMDLFETDFSVPNRWVRNRLRAGV